MYIALTLKSDLFCVLALCIRTFSQSLFICKYWWMFLYIRNIQYEALFFFIQRMTYSLQILGATHHILVTVMKIKAPACIGHHLGCLLRIYFGSILISEMAIVSRIQFVLRHMFVEKLLILCGHFILQFMCFPSAVKPTKVLPLKWPWHWSRQDISCLKSQC